MPTLDNEEKDSFSNEPSLEYVSTGCNRAPHALEWGRNGLVAFGACNSVVIYDPQPNDSAGKIKYMLNKHNGRVSSVHWISSKDGTLYVHQLWDGIAKSLAEITHGAPSLYGLETEIVSGSADKTICIWKEIGSEWMLSQQLQGHKNAIHALASIHFHDKSREKDVTVLASSSADSTVIIWQKVDDPGYEALQTLTFGNGFSLSLAMGILPQSEAPILACGCDDAKIHLFSRQGEKFVAVKKLQGHEDWIQTVHFSASVNDDIYVVSGSKDCFIRIWKISLKKCEHAINSDELKLEEEKFSINEKEYSIVLESVLTGHDGWVNGVRWRPSFFKDKKLMQPMEIVSASMDKTMMVWKLDEESGVWMDSTRMGEVGGNTLGFYGCSFSPDGKTVLAHGFQGAFHLWKSSDNQQWKPEVTISGHFGPAQDFEWDPVNSEFLMSVSNDQTARLHAPWTHDGKKTTWHEIARPQVHGYDMQCIACINRSMYASGSEEKVIRVFGAPKSFFESLSTISQISCNTEANEALPLGASVPALGLSNKAVFQSDLESWKDEGDKSQPMKASAFASEDPAPYTHLTITAPPPEDILLQNTLWPEVHKLYGHGFEIFCLTCNPQGTVLASACKASKAEHANILLWDTKSWKQVGNLVAHTLTVTQLSFSNSGEWLLSVSRDRTWALFKKNTSGESGSPYALTQKTDKHTSIHTRIIWSCCWTHDDKYFATASRDKKVIIWGWKESTNTWGPASESLDVGEPATAISSLSYILPLERYIFAVGKESGLISICSWSAISNIWSLNLHLKTAICPTLTVKRLRWNMHQIPKRNNEETNFEFKLAACSSDSSLRIINIPLSLLN